MTCVICHSINQINHHWKNRGARSRSGPEIFSSALTMCYTSVLRDAVLIFQQTISSNVNSASSAPILVGCEERARLAYYNKHNKTRCKGQNKYSHRVACQCFKRLQFQWQLEMYMQCCRCWPHWIEQNQHQSKGKDRKTAARHVTSCLNWWFSTFCFWIQILICI